MRRYMENNALCRRLACLLMAVLLLCVLPQTARAEGESGTCGDNLTWSFSAGTLTISGSGAMTDFTEATMAPWYELRSQILRLELPDGLTCVGDLAFYDCQNLGAVTVPDSVIRIGKYAFANCKGMTMLTLSASLETVEEGAFSDCVRLTALRLPEGLKTIGMKAFYRCESIPAVIVPESVTTIGMSAFSYCKSLVSADIRAKINTVPEWLFYGCGKLVSVSLPKETDTISEFAFRGCDQLITVYYDGSEKTPEEIQNIIDEDVPGFDSTGLVTPAPAPGSATSGATQENTDGTFTQQNTTVTQGTNSTVTSNLETTRQEDGTGVSSSVQIQITVENEDGWQDAQQQIDEALKDFSDNAAAVGGETGKAEITVYVKDTEVPPEFVQQAAGKDMVITVITQDGSAWRVDGKEFGTQSGAYDMRYSLTAGSAELCKELGVESCFVLRFFSAAEIRTELMVRLDPAFGLRTATLLQRDGKAKQIQSVVVDQEGYARFYLAAVSNQMEYYIALDLPTQEKETIVPETLYNYYGNPLRMTPIEYEITGIKSSWGLTGWQVTLIFMGVFVACVVTVGVVMYQMNKRKLKRGYIPDISEELDT